MVVFPNAKINLGLNILSKREDGYHNISSVFYPIPVQDILEILPADSFRFNSSGLSIPGSLEGNLIVKAYRLLSEKYHLPPVNIHLHKILPMGAGLGGGSADAAFTIKLLNNLFELRLSASAMEEYAGLIGSDCPFFIKNVPVLAEGTGNKFSNITLDLTGKYLVLICPDVHIGTVEAYRHVKPVVPEKSAKDIVEKSAMHEWRDHLKNDFEDSVFRTHPELKEIKEKLYNSGAIYASMSGSGSSIYGLFEHQPMSLGLPNILWKGTL